MYAPPAGLPLIWTDAVSPARSRIERPGRADRRIDERRSEIDATAAPLTQSATRIALSRGESG